MNLTILKAQTRRRAKLAATATLAAAAGLLVTGLLTGYAAAQTPDEKVYQASEKGVTPPRVLHKTDPKYTESAREAKITGAVILAVEISTKGKAENIRVQRSLEESLDQSAIETVKQWTFQPATRYGEPVRVKATIEVNFRP